MEWSRERPPKIADERTQLIGWLGQLRAIVAWKSDGLSAADAQRTPLPSSPLMSMAGLLSHLRWTEHCWFEVIFLNRPDDDNPQFRDPEDADWMLAAESDLPTLVAEYRAQCEISDAIVAEHALDDVAQHPEFGGATLRWILLHMLEETGRHAGHADIVRELLDGDRGYY